jgi:hypothetical protein
VYNVKTGGQIMDYVLQLHHIAQCIMGGRSKREKGSKRGKGTWPAMGQGEDRREALRVSRMNGNM